MVDKDSRKRAVGLLKKAVLGRITNYECEDGFLDLISESKDGVLFAIFRTIREASGEDERSLSEIFPKGHEMRKRLCRWILFLKSDLEYEWPRERLAPGLRDLYRPNWLDEFTGAVSRISRSNTNFFSQGNYSVWPFVRKEDYDTARTSYRNRVLSHTPPPRRNRDRGFP